MKDAIFSDDDKFFMKEALKEAFIAFSKKEVPIGAVLVLHQKIIARAHNLVESAKDPTAHAEMQCIRDASANSVDWRLVDAVLYTTVEPCCMCYGGALLSRLKKVVYGTPDIRQGALGSWVDLSKHQHPIHSIEVLGGLYAKESSSLLKEFFKQVRDQKSTLDMKKLALPDTVNLSK